MEITLLSLENHKNEIKFWIEALSNKDISESNKVLINKCLNNELNIYLSPILVLQEKEGHK